MLFRSDLSRKSTFSHLVFGLERFELGLNFLLLHLLLQYSAYVVFKLGQLLHLLVLFSNSSQVISAGLPVRGLPLVV